jgi:hypothetical protein
MNAKGFTDGEETNLMCRMVIIFAKCGDSW